MTKLSKAQKNVLGALLDMGGGSRGGRKRPIYSYVVYSSYHTRTLEVLFRLGCLRIVDAHAFGLSRVAVTDLGLRMWKESK